MDAAAEIGRNPVLFKHQIQPTSLKKEQADAGRDGRTRLARPDSQPRRGVGNIPFPYSIQLTTRRIRNLTRLIHTRLLNAMIIHLRFEMLFDGVFELRTFAATLW